MKEVKIVDRRIVFDKFFKIEEAQFRYEKFNGEMTDVITRLNFERGDSVAAIIYNEDTDKVILVNQFRFPCYDKAGGWITEVVAGSIDEGESPESAVKREIIEETGFKIRSMEKIASFFVSPGGTSEKIYLFYVAVNQKCKISEGGGLESENEDIKIVEYSPQEISYMIKHDEIIDAKTIIACNFFISRHNIK